MVIQERLVDLKFDDLEALRAAAELPANNQLKKLTSSRAFSHFETLYGKAELKRKQGDEEQGYIMYSRMCEIAKLIIKKRDFSEFKVTPGGRLLYRLFEEGVSRLQELQKSLSTRYDLKNLEKRYERKDEANVSPGSSFVPISEEKADSEMGLTIRPRELVKMIESKKKILLIDFQDDQSSTVKYECPGRVFVARVPRAAVVPGCISTTLICSAEISERAALQHMSDVDLVVLVGSESPLRVKDGLRAGSVEQILFDALFTYNNNFRLKRPPVFLDGGFRNWDLHYPMHVRRETGAAVNFGLDDQSRFARVVAEYAQDLAVNDVSGLKYPDLSRPPKRAPSKSILSNDLQSEDQAFRTSDYRSVPETSRVTPIVRTDISAAETFSGYKAEPLKGVICDFDTKSDAKILPIDRDSSVLSVKPSEQVDFNVVADAKVPGEFRAGKQANDRRILGESSKAKVNASVPLVDRSTKPQVFPKVCQIPNVDRSSKPKLCSFLDQDEASKNRSLDPVEADMICSNLPIQAEIGEKARGGAKPDGVLPPAAPLIPDRSKKPMPEDRLLDVYRMGLEEIHARAKISSVLPGYTGLVNLRNTCYMNATLQALFNTLPLRNIFVSSYWLNFINRTNSKGTMGICSAAFAALMSGVWSGKYLVINPSFFREVFIRHVNRDFADFEQHDAQEFQIFLLATLHEDMDQVRKPVIFQQDYSGDNVQKEAIDFEKNWRLYTNSPVNDLFRCVTVSVKCCKTCGQKSVSFEEITQLSIPITKPFLGDCISAHFDQFLLEGDSKWKCPKCKVYRDTSLKTDIWKAPEILVVHLKRSKDGIIKNDALVTFNAGFLSIRNCMHPLKASDAYHYSLYAVINHSGSLNSGHYTAYVQNVQNDGTKQWLYCDDEVVKPMNEDALCTKNAVVLYFQRNK